MYHTHANRTTVAVIAALIAALAVPTAAFASLRADQGRFAGGSTTPLAAAPAAPAVPAPASTDPAPSVTDAGTLAADLAFMREEEKLARDVYTVLGEKWDLRVFTNIARSEQTHMDALLVLIERYGFADPAAGQPTGTFTDPHLQDLYDQLVATGSASSAAALEVGKLIEETDIADLDDRIARTDEADVLTVYQNLRAGSENHLAAFNKLIAGDSGPSSTTGGRGRRGGR